MSAELTGKETRLTLRYMHTRMDPTFHLRSAEGSPICEPGDRTRADGGKRARQGGSERYSLRAQRDFLQASPSEPPVVVETRCQLWAEGPQE